MYPMSEAKNVKKDDRLVEPTKHGLEVLEASFIKRMELANELGEKDERIERLTEIYQTDHNVEFSWHKQCYSHFTDNSKVKRLEEKVKKKSDAERLNESCSIGVDTNGKERISHRSIDAVDWENVYFVN